MRGIHISTCSSCRLEHQRPSSASPRAGPSRSCARGTLQVVGVDDHLLLHQAADHVVAEIGQPDGSCNSQIVRDAPVPTPGGRNCSITYESTSFSSSCVRPRLLLVVLVGQARAVPAPPEVAKSPGGCRRSPPRRCFRCRPPRRPGVVELVDELHVADAEPVGLVEPRVDLARCTWAVVVDVAPERLRDLDALDPPRACPRRSRAGPRTGFRQIRYQPLPGPPFWASIILRASDPGSGAAPSHVVAVVPP